MMNLIPGMDTAVDALNAEKLRLELISENIANANTTRTAEGGPYQRKLAMFESYMARNNGTAQEPSLRSVRVTGIHKDDTPGIQVHSPYHPHADENGMLTLPNVQTAREMVDLISASRSYQANLTVIKTARQMASMAMMIGKGR